MSGWRRLWIVASILLGVPVLLLSLQARDYSSYIFSEKDPAAASRWVARTATEMRAQCSGRFDKPVARWDSYTSSYDGSASCTTTVQKGLSFLYALIPALLLAGAGLTIRWIYRGFRTPRE